MPPTEIPDMVTLAIFSDLEGNVVGMIKGRTGVGLLDCRRARIYHLGNAGSDVPVLWAIW
jgi:hypothetical protein